MKAGLEATSYYGTYQAGHLYMRKRASQSTIDKYYRSKQYIEEKDPK